MNLVYKFDSEFCDRLISIVDKNRCYSYEICRADNPDIETEELQPTNSLQFIIDNNSHEDNQINDIVKNIINNTNSIKSIIQISDNTKKYIPHKYQNSYVIVSLLNDSFEGGRVSIDNTLISLQKGECICITPSQIVNIEPIISGERYCLVVYIDINFKNNKSII
jgi:hypothetical protein